ncbi:porin [Oceanisphaera psychrotolerans]|uniref:Porin n=1 Tax=Oceanisphaera psychrotolerans TaxID=1414654 RepID=A0A1J4QBS5_9GAMM|nr:porin [Oceanisphaera psychrotolerans]OIN07985.1 porin [Oceanisphaera psychrotolerans]
MKKTILALTIPALFATSASAVTVYSDEGAQVDIYGRVQYEAGERGYQDAGKAENFGGDGEARLGVNVKYDLNNDVDLIGKLEWSAVTEADGASDGASAGNSLKSRYAWAGFRFMDTTDLTFGRSQDPYAQTMYYTDVLNIYGGSAAYGSIGLADDKTDDQIRVSYAANGVDLRAGYAFADADKSDVNEAKDSQWSASAGYTTPFGLGVSAAYEQQKFGTATVNDLDFGGAGDHDFDAWIAGVNYSIDGFYFAAIYTEQELKNDSAKLETEGYELHAQYSVDAWTLLAQYSNEEAKTGDLKWDSIDSFTLGAQYALTPKAKLYAEYVISDSEGLNDDDSVYTKDDVYGVGIQYNF